MSMTVGPGHARSVCAVRHKSDHHALLYARQARRCVREDLGKKNRSSRNISVQKLLIAFISADMTATKVWGLQIAKR